MTTPEIAIIGAGPAGLTLPHSAPAPHPLRGTRAGRGLPHPGSLDLHPHSGHAGTSSSPTAS
ncbi:Uu.00g126620.m01.CDS01 [Anthostomella pinea]|uniref:Uu.00g126620.m01.CDS01 n=1 Tax=Anthostomella pinea TaxID=933095 RepID=A0AAI8VI12_9PEZI|nr:Uu.00g126620.m01.CDS01 [Anthostomella pinea]